MAHIWCLIGLGVAVAAGGYGGYMTKSLLSRLTLAPKESGKTAAGSEPASETKK